jgi:hypothetical protein
MNYESTVRNRQGYTLIVVLLGMAFISSLSLVLVQYGRWQTKIKSVQSNIYKLQQARRVASGWSQHYLKNTLPDSPVLNGPIKRKWSLPPDITVQAKIKSLNGKINLNRFQRANAGKVFLNLVESMLEDMNYPNRVMRELAQWIIPEENRTGLNRAGYAGYNYSPPERAIYQMDEIKLISGFKAIGLTEEFRQTFTIYGSGDLNPLHFAPDEWRRFERAVGPNLPNIPEAALQNNETLRKYLQQETVWSELTNKLQFLTKRDNSFKISIRAKRHQTVRRTESIYTYNYDKKRINVRARFVTRSDTSAVD